MVQGFVHEPVMLREVVELAAPVPAGLFVDATVGGGGHAAAVLDARPDLRLLGIDRDDVAVAAARRRLEGFGPRAEIRRSRFDHLGEVLDGEGLGADGLAMILFDLGVSSPQLDDPGRGFAFQYDGPLDMRMDPTSGTSARELVNEFDEAALAALFAAHGEERFARRIARALVASRPVSTTAELAAIVASAIPAAARRRGHPARRVFQAIRVEVNEELAQLGPAIDDAIDRLVPGGRIVVLSYHSGEDRLTKAHLVRAATGGCVCPPGLPCVCGAMPTLRLLNRGARLASADEISRNPRAESARLRAAERLEAVRVGSDA
jgi:16S rRNA (cytosine1402-N4)-methyltransferase